MNDGLVSPKDQVGQLSLNNNSKVFIFGSKSGTLKNLSNLICKSAVPEFISFTVGDWQKDPKKHIAAIKLTFKSQIIIIRSSSLSEDSDK